MQKEGRNILFLANSVSVGTSGVADYTRKLAQECQRQGANCSIVGLDNNATKVSLGMVDGVIRTLSIPGIANNSERIALVKDFITKQPPQWISFQYSPYGYFNKGIPRFTQFYEYLMALFPYRQIMAHELWLGISKDAPVKERLIGVLQKQNTRFFFKKFKPTLIHSHAGPYLYELKKLGLSSHRLPLFTNIDINKAESSNELWDHYFARSREGRQRIRFVFFGGVPKEWDASLFYSPLKKWLEEQPDYTAQFLFCGRTGLTESQRTHFKGFNDINLETAFSDCSKESDIAKLILSADYGVAGSPIKLYEKSSSVAAMLSAGLRVIFPRNDFIHLSHFDTLAGHLLFGDWTNQLLQDATKKKRVSHDLSTVAEIFLNDLKRSEVIKE